MLPPNPQGLFPPPGGANNFLPPTQFFPGAMLPGIPGSSFGQLPPPS